MEGEGEGKGEGKGRDMNGVGLAQKKDHHSKGKIG